MTISCGPETRAQPPDYLHNNMYGVGSAENPTHGTSIKMSKSPGVRGLLWGSETRGECDVAEGKGNEKQPLSVR